MKHLILFALMLAVPWGGLAAKKADSASAVSGTAKGESLTAGSKIRVILTGLKNSKGKARARLFDSKAGFPSATNALAARTGNIVNGRSEVIFENLKPGLYAISAFHDELSDGKLKFGVLGIPVEGTGVSNDAKGRLGPPAFEDAQFRYDGGELVVYVPIHY